MPHRPVAVLVLALFALIPVPAHASNSLAPSLHTWRTFLTSPVVRQPSGIAIDLRGNPRQGQWAYVADSATGRIVKFGTGGHVLASWSYGPPGHPAVLAVGGAGNLFVADEVDGNISKFSSAGKRLAVWTPRYIMPLAMPRYTDPRAIAVDPSGKIYLAEYTAHRVIQLTPGGTLLQAWDTLKGFTAQYSVPHQNSGPFGYPTGLAYDPPGHLLISTFCLTSPACRTDWPIPAPSYGHDALLVLSVNGAFTGYVGNYWFGLGFAASGAPVEVPGKESEPFIHIDAMAGDGKGHAFLAGTFWPRGGQPSSGVLAYTDLGSRTGPWNLPSPLPVSGIAVDGSGAIYVSQGARVLVGVGLRADPSSR